MNKEDLINAIKEEDVILDEREQDIKKMSFVKGYEGMYIAMVVLILVRTFTEDKFYNDLGMIITGQAIFMSFYLYKEGRNTRLNMIFMIFMSVLFLLMTYLTLSYYEIF